jgi:hypothetical protein
LSARNLTSLQRGPEGGVGHTDSAAMTFGNGHGSMTLWTNASDGATVLSLGPCADDGMSTVDTKVEVAQEHG